MGIRARRDRGADGAAAVEFALVMPILFLVVFGILQYGLWFNDSLNTRQGVREGARLGVVSQFDGDGCSGANLDKLACRTENRIDALTGEERACAKRGDPWRLAVVTDAPGPTAQHKLYKPAEIDQAPGLEPLLE